MSLTDDERNAIVSFRIQKAKDTLAEAEGISTLKYWNAVANRLHYSCFYMTSALLIQNNFSVQTHSGVIHLFGLHFIRTGVISKDAGKLYSKLFELRQTGDYDDLFNLTEEDVAPMITLVHQFLDELNGKITNYPANIVLKPDNIQKCIEVLQKHKLELVSASEMYKI